MEGEYLRELPPDEKKRLGYIEGREDLFRTKIFELESEDCEKPQYLKNIVVEARDPGAANALLPVVKLLEKDGNIGIKIIADGRAQEIFQNEFKLKNITPNDNVLRIAEIVGSPDAFLASQSTERGLEMFSAATFPEVPAVVVQDYYPSSIDIEYFRRLKESGMPYPEKVCVIDEEAKRILIESLPDLADSVVVTGSPASDKFAHENTEKIAAESRKQLNLGQDETLITFMSSIDGMDLVQRFADELAKIKGVKFDFRRHPRDNVSMDDYQKEFESRGIEIVDTADLTTDQVGAASDLVITTISTEGLNAIYRRKPNINIIDTRYSDRGAPPSVKLGASFSLDKMDNLVGCVKNLLDPKSKERKALNRGMEENYPVDGKNAQRVVDVLKNLLKKE